MGTTNKTSRTRLNTTKVILFMWLTKVGNRNGNQKVNNHFCKDKFTIKKSTNIVFNDEDAN